MGIPESLHESKLYNKLIELVNEQNLLQKEKENRNKALTLVNEICREASETMKVVPTLFPEYTLHDEVHLVRVTHLMSLILSESGSLNNLSYIEITILILAAYLHDIGMAPPKLKIESIIKSSQFSLFRKTRKRDLQGLRELNQVVESSSISEDEKRILMLRIAEIEQSILTDYLRQQHGTMSEEEIINKWSDDARWEIDNHNIADIVAMICKGHTLHPEQLTGQYSANFVLDQVIGATSIHRLYCTLILRLADILDFDRERTPSVLFENISPKNSISIEEWNKHRSVTGWSITKKRIIFECECTHPVYEKSLREFIDYIDYELQSCLLIVREFPQRNGIAEKYVLKLPSIVDRTKIYAKNNSYSYLDLSFKLSHEEIMKLLMGREMWGGTSLCIRELIQNAYDAIRYRRALELSVGNQWNAGKITLIQRINKEGCLEFVCKDNGIGMNKYILENYFFRIGRSYYKSPEFEQERVGLREKNSDFDPVSQFGIGIVSTFLIGDLIKIKTQRYLGPNKGCGDNLMIEVDGLSRMAVIKIQNDDNPNPGTEIIVVGKKMSEEEAKDGRYDPLHLLEATQYYAAALDIPIEIIIDPPFKNLNVTIDPPSRPLKLKTYFEENLDTNSEDYIILERDFSKMYRDCEGSVRVVFLRDSDGRICLKNRLAHWKKNKNNEDRISLVMVKDNKSMLALELTRAVLSQDGILISQNCKKREQLHFYGLRYPTQIGSYPGSYFLNLKGISKLPLKPNRAPYQPSLAPIGKEEEIWWEFQRKLNGFISGILEDVLYNKEICPTAEVFWSIVYVYDFTIYEISKNAAYENICLPFTTNYESSTLEWTSASNLLNRGFKYILLGYGNYFGNEKEHIIFIPMKDYNVNLCADGKLRQYIKSIIRTITVMKIEGTNVIYEIKPFETPFLKLSKSHYSASAFNWIYYQVYSDDLNEFLGVNNATEGMNYNHPVTQFIINHKKTENPQHKYFIDGLIHICKALINCSDFDEKHISEWQDDLVSTIKAAIFCWRKVNWGDLPLEVKPPYKFLFPNSGNVYNITIECLEERMEKNISQNYFWSNKLIDLN